MKKDVLEYVRDNTELRATIAHLSAVIEEARAHCEVNIKFYYAVGMGDISAAYEGVLSILAKAELTSLRESLPLPREVALCPTCGMDHHDYEVGSGP